jgi:hypothetical protein
MLWKKVLKLTPKKRTYFATIVIGMLIWGGMFMMTSPLSPPKRLDFPADHHLLFTFRTQLHYTQLSFHQLPIDNKIRVEGVLRGRPKSIGDQTAYTCLFDKLVIRDDKERLLLSFTRDQHYNHLYKTDPLLTYEERQAVYQAFQIDPTGNASSDDESLLQQPVKFVISPQGQIREIGLTTKLRDTIFNTINPYKGAFIAREFLQFSERIPPLFPPGREGENWVTGGIFLQPIRFIHRTTERKDQKIQFATVSRPLSADEDGSALAELEGKGNARLGFQEKKIDQNEWKLNWTYDEIKKRIEELALTIDLKVSKKIFKNEDLVALGVKLDGRIDFEPAPYALSQLEDL